MSLALMLLAAQPAFEQYIRPVLEKQCHSCHNSTTHQGGLDLTSRDKILRGGDRGPAVVPGDPQSSLLFAYINHERQPGMPLGGQKLSADVIARFGQWIKDGARFEEAAAPLQSDHWSFQRPKQTPVPKEGNEPNAIDAFLAVERNRRGLKPLGEAGKSTLVRRAYLDLTGLPPDPQQVREFVADASPQAWEKLVDRLLASKQYGERWGRHWMDVWRYSDWYGSGAEVRNSQRHIWQWRDWIVESLNEDKGYDGMVREMLAGDEIAPNNVPTLRATGFLARNWFRFNRNVWLMDTIESTSAAFLGVTLKCARCHDHKYDPFRQEDYYRFRAFFEPHDIRIDKLPGFPDRKKGGLPRAYDSEPKGALPDVEGGINVMPVIFDKTYLFVRGDENEPDKSHAIEPGVPPVLGGPPVKIAPVELSTEAFYPDIQDFVARDLMQQARDNVKAVEEKLAQMHAELEAARREQTVPEPSGEPIDFEKQIKPIFEGRCFTCHQGRNSKGGLSLASVASIKAGGKSGAAVIAGKSAESVLLQSLRGIRQPRMPFNGPALEPAAIELIARWVDQLPRRKPAEIIRESPGQIVALEKELAAAKAAVPALEARIKAEQARYAKPPSADLETLSEAARKTEREYNLLRTEEQIFRAQQKMAEALAAPLDVRDKAVAAAKRNLETALDALNKPADAYSPLGPVHTKVSTGRRLALAGWIASNENPLTARVAVNHIWMRHFGAPLVPSVIDFGKNGKAPTHPELLDWLAVDFMNHGWSMKHLHRVILTSKAYRMESASAAGNPNLKIDANNVWLWRMNPRRLEAEAIRDSILRVAGSLDTTMGGPELNEESQQDTPRRSLYFRLNPNAQMQFLKVFDGADPTACYRRSESIMPQQALALTNSALSQQQAKVLAVKLPQEDFVGRAFETVLGRAPSAAEREKSEAYLSGSASVERGRESLIHVLFNRNEFVTIR